MKQIVSITRLTGKTTDSFPKTAWLGGDRSNIASIEANVKDAVMKACDIKASDDIDSLKEAGKEVEAYALIGERTLTAQTATQDDIDKAAQATTPLVVGQLGYVFPNPQTPSQMLVTVQAYKQLNVLKVGPTFNSLLSQLKDTDEITAAEAYQTSQRSKTSMGTEQAKLDAINEANAKQADDDAKKILERRRAEKEAKNKAHTADLTGAPAQTEKATA